MRRYNFVLRIYQTEKVIPVLTEFDNITISDLPLISKTSKFGGFVFHRNFMRKYGYSVELSKPFNRVSGSHSSPTLTFRGKYIDIIVKNFPRYPAFYQDKYAARNCLAGYGYINYLNDGFPIPLLYRKVEIIHTK